MDVHAFFCPLVNFFYYSGLTTSKYLEKSPKLCHKVTLHTVKCIRTVYLSSVWIWTVVMSVNVFYMGITEKRTVKNSTHSAQHQNMVISLLEESPFAFITIRNASVLTIFIAKFPQMLDGIEGCEKLRGKLASYGGKVSFERFRFRPVLYMITAVVTIILWEIYEWTVYFTVDGWYFEWNLTPFPVVLFQFKYACFWWVFSTIPFIFAQVALCFPVIFAITIRCYCHFINKELAHLNKVASTDASDVLLVQLGQRVSILRAAHFDLRMLVRQVDKAVNCMLLVQFFCDVVTLFGFLGLLVNSKDMKPLYPTLEWTFFIPTSLAWLLFFLFHFSMPLIHMAEEGERTHQLVHMLTFSSAKLFKAKFRDISVFLDEARTTTLAFTGGHFYYVNRHYVVTCVALIGTYLTILTEILDRYYGTEDLKRTIAQLDLVIRNQTISSH